MMKKSLLALVVLILFSGTVFSDDILIMDYIPSASISAIGGAHAAQADGLSVLFTNPAGFQSVDSLFSISELTIGLHGPVFDIANMVVALLKGGDLNTIISQNSDLISSLNAGLDITGPLYFGYVGDGLGFGIFNTTEVYFRSTGVAIEAAAAEQIYLVGGYAFRIPFSEAKASYFDIGIMLKASVRGEVVMSKTVFELLNFASLDLDLLSQPFVFSAGIGVDVGLRYSLGDYFAVGLVAEDAFTAVFDRTYSSLTSFLAVGTPVNGNRIIPFKLNGGFMFSPPLGLLGRVISDIDIYIDYNDILDFLVSPETSRNPLLNISIGLDILLLDILSVRLGFYEGLFSAGLGLDLTIFDFNASMYGSEKGVEPGQSPIYNVVLGFEFRS